MGLLAACLRVGISLPALQNFSLLLSATPILLVKDGFGVEGEKKDDLRFLPTLFCLEAALPLAGSLLIHGVYLFTVGCWLQALGGTGKAGCGPAKH